MIVYLVALPVPTLMHSNGLLDPWSAGGVLEPLSDSLVTIIIPSGAHHLDLRASNPADPSDVTAARNKEREHISNWLKDFQSTN